MSQKPAHSSPEHCMEETRCVEAAWMQPVKRVRTRTPNNDTDMQGTPRQGVPRPATAQQLHQCQPRERTVNHQSTYVRVFCSPPTHASAQSPHSVLDRVPTCKVQQELQQSPTELTRTKDETIDRGHTTTAAATRSRSYQPQPSPCVMTHASKTTPARLTPPLAANLLAPPA